MELSLKHLGKLRKAVVPLDGITLISGFNNSGKSTIIKAVYTLMSSFVAIKKNMERKAERDEDLIESNDETDASLRLLAFDDALIYKTIVKTEMLPYFGSSIANAHNPQHPAKISLKLSAQSTHQEHLNLSIHGNDIRRMQHVYQLCPKALLQEYFGLSDDSKEPKDTDAALEAHSALGALGALDAPAHDSRSAPHSDVSTPKHTSDSTVDNNSSLNVALSTLAKASHSFSSAHNAQIDTKDALTVPAVTLNNAHNVASVINAASKLSAKQEQAMQDQNNDEDILRHMSWEHHLSDKLPREVLLIDEPEILLALNALAPSHRRSERLNKLKPHHKSILSLIINYAPQPLPKVHEKINHILSKLCPGELKAREHDYVYATKYEGKSVYLDLNMLSTSHSLALLCKALLSRGIFNKHTLLVWDDFERGLHPQDQVHMMNFLFLLNKHLKVKIVFSTNSIYVVRALRAFNVKSRLEDEEKLIRAFLKEKTPDLNIESLSEIKLSKDEAAALRTKIKEQAPKGVNFCLLKCNTRVSVNMSKMRVLQQKNDADLDVLNVHLAGSTNRLIKEG